MKKNLTKKRLLLFVILFTSLGLVNVTLSSCDKDSENTGAPDKPTIEIPEQGSYDNLDLEIATRREDAVYSKDETIYFDVKAESEGKPVVGSVNYTLTNDGVSFIKTGIAVFEDGKAEISFDMKKPMVVRCEVVYKSKNNKEFSALAAAAISPFEIEPTATEPDDFKSYWNGQIDNLRKIPMNAQLKSVGAGLYDITIDNIDGSKLHAYLGVPSGAGPFPAILSIPGAGVSAASRSRSQSYLNQGFLVLTISIHDLPNDQPSKFYEDKKTGELSSYRTDGRESRDTYYFRRVLLGCIRSIDYLTSHEKWNGKSMIIRGSSQGGGLALMTAGLHKKVSAATVNVPALCEHSGQQYGRPAGWPQLVPIRSGKLDPAILKTSEYYDAVNFSRYIDVPVVFGVGLLDDTCAATTVFSAYNQLKGNKVIDIAPFMGHAWSPTFNIMRDNFITEQGNK